MMATKKTRDGRAAPRFRGARKRGARKNALRENAARGKTRRAKTRCATACATARRGARRDLKIVENGQDCLYIMLQNRAQKTRFGSRKKPRWGVCSDPTCLPWLVGWWCSLAQSGRVANWRSSSLITALAVLHFRFSANCDTGLAFKKTDSVWVKFCYVLHTALFGPSQMGSCNDSWIQTLVHRFLKFAALQTAPDSEHLQFAILKLAAA